VSPLADAVDRERIRTSLDETFAVEAAAGTGKTTVLVDRIVNVLASGRTTVERIVAVTFSEKAAGELKLRLRAELETRRQSSAAAGDGAPARALAAALANLEQAHVSTIHTFCADLLRERPVEARVDPRFTMLTETQARALFAAVFHDWLQAHLEAPPPGVRRALRRRSYDDDGPIGRLERAAWILTEWRDFTTPWQPGAFDQVARVDALADAVFAFARLTEAAADAQDALYQDTEPARRVANEVAVSEQVRRRDYDGLEAQLVALDSYKFKRPRTGRRSSAYARGVARAHVLDAHAALVTRLAEFRCDADADLASRLHGELTTAIDAYESAKARVGALDFLDLLVRARDLVRNNQDVRAAFQRRFTHLFVDEFQDTDPLQAEILLLLAADDPAETRWRSVRPAAGKLFVVGDPKQSIYRFRRADVGIYEAVREQLRAQGAACVALRSSFRAVPDIQRAVNAAFAPRMTGDAVAVQASYVPLAAVRPAQSGQPALVALPVPRVKMWNGAPTKASIAEGQPHAVAAFVHWLIAHSGWTVTDRERPGARAPIQARDVCLLFRRFDTRTFDGPTVDVTRPYVQALEARNLPHLLVGGKSFHEREEVETLRAALAAIEWPDDELSVFGTLRGALFAFGDDVLLDYWTRASHFRPFQALEAGPEDAALPAPLREVSDALRLLRDLHLRRNQRPVAATIAALLDASRAHAIFALRPSGEQALANVQYVGELARQYEAGGGLSFRGFVERLREEAEETRAAEAPILEEGSDGVRLMTVHKAKGLEFPVVVLVDIGAELSRGSASRWVDSEGARCAVSLAGWAPAELREHAPVEIARDEAEGVRVAYVAATRARDLLVVCAVGDAPHAAGWVSPLNAAIYPAADRRREAVRDGWAEHFGGDSTIDREDTIPLTSVRPGIHAVEGEEPYAVTWWDPAALDLDRQPTFGLRREELIAKDAAPGVVDAGLDAFARWRVAREASVEQGRRPSYRVVTVRARAAQLAESATLFTAPGHGPGQGPGDAPGDSPGHAPGDVPGHSPGHGSGDGPGHSPGHDSGDGPGHAPGHGPGDGPGRDVLVEAIPRPGGVVGGGLRFGALVHAVLALVPLDASPAIVQALAAQQARVLAADAVETEAAARVVSGALGHPAFAPLRAAASHGGLRREVPVALAEPSGAIIEGVVDAAYETPAGWVVVDFKTDADPGESLDAYLGQIRLYARAIATATGRPASGLLIRL
jgi:ATP-dependent helicase/nuclease subunit A